MIDSDRDYVSGETTIFVRPKVRIFSPSKMTKLFPNSPGNYHRPTSGYDQKTITIIVISAQR